MTLALCPVSGEPGDGLEPRRTRVARIAGARAFFPVGCFPFILPVAAPAAVAGGLLIFLTSFNELTVSAMALVVGHGDARRRGVLPASYRSGNSPPAAPLATRDVRG